MTEANEVARCFWEKVERRGADECWPWLGTGVRGYGRIGKKLATHIALEIAGVERPTLSHGALHSCDNPPCVNPAHLRWGTQRENAADARDRHRFLNLQKTHCPRGHEYTPENTMITNRKEGWKDRHCRECERLRKRGWRKRRSIAMEQKNA
jgi:hypothetical protein